MINFLSGAARVLIIAMLLGGFLVTVGQIVGITIGSGDLVLRFGSLVGPVSAVAGIAGILAFLCQYPRRLRSNTQAADVDPDEFAA